MSSSKPDRDILVTSALPYANGSIHLGHLVEYIQTDIWVRFQKLRGHRCIFVCATDAHGTPTMLRARRENIAPEELVDKITAEHEADLRAFGVDFDQYDCTHSKATREYVYKIYAALQENDCIYTKTVNQAFDAKEQMFLPDRFVRGTCPYCATPDQYGDSCESCGRTYDPKDLKNPVSAVSGTTPEYRDSEHYFFRLSRFEGFLRDWMRDAKLDAGVRKKLEEWFEKGLADWDISRDAPYFGFEIPGAKDKYFYVWLDAPVGYIGSFARYAARKDLAVDDFWSADSDAEVYHFIGKDIIYFHALFWPAVLHAAGMRPPTSLFAHGFLTVNGEKMSKSRGTFINGATYLRHLDATYLRYYYAAKTGNGIDDIDMNLDDFSARVNADLVGKFVNLASRNAGFIKKRFDGLLSDQLPEPALYQEFVAAGDEIAACYEDRDFPRAMRQIMALADSANQYVDRLKPWTLLKDPARGAEVQGIATQALNLFRVLAIYLAPVLPEIAEKVREFFGESDWQWQAVATPLLSSRIETYQPLLTRIETKSIDAMTEEAREPETATATPETPTIDFDTFMSVDLRAAKIVAAEAVEGADKLLRLHLNLGELGDRQVFAGIKSAYDPADLVGRIAVCVANLAPRKMRFGVSEGMLLAASNGESIHLLSLDTTVLPGTRIR